MTFFICTYHYVTVATKILTTDISNIPLHWKTSFCFICGDWPCMVDIILQIFFKARTWHIFYLLCNLNYSYIFHFQEYFRIWGFAFNVMRWVSIQKAHDIICRYSGTITMKNVTFTLKSSASDWEVLHLINAMHFSTKPLPSCVNTMIMQYNFNSSRAFSSGSVQFNVMRWDVLLYLDRMTSSAKYTKITFSANLKRTLSAYSALFNFCTHNSYCMYHFKIYVHSM